jgi:1,4-dihydroxy-6-naphthoate synthase
VAIPGRATTAFRLLQLAAPALGEVVAMRYDRILQAVAQGDVDAGLIIHESRFTYPRYGLESLLDLGAWWERHSGLPIPLGGILGKRSLGADTLRKIESAIGESLQYARAHPEEVLAYCRQHSQEMDEKVMMSHISLYVNDFTRDLGSEGIAAVRRLFAEAEERGIFPPSDKPLLAGDR